MIWNFWIPLALMVAFAIIGYWRGKDAGKQTERDRCVRLCTESLQRDSKVSASARRILHAITTECDHLMSEDELFGKARPRPLCDHDPVPTSAGPFCSKCGDEL